MRVSVIRLAYRGLIVSEIDTRTMNGEPKAWIRKRTKKIVAVLVPILAAVAWFVAQPTETPIERAHRVCRECGLTNTDVRWLIDHIKDMKLSREKALRVLLDTYFEDGDPQKRKQGSEQCLPCNEAILDAAGVFGNDG